MDSYPIESYKTKLCTDGIVPFDNYLDSMRSAYINMENHQYLWNRIMCDPLDTGVANFKAHSLQNYCTRFAINCFPVTGRISFLLADGTHIGFNIPMYEATFRPLIEKGLNLTFTDSEVLFTDGVSLDYVGIDKLVSTLYRENVDYIMEKEPASLQITCMYALHKFSCYDWNAIYAKGLLPSLIVRAFVRYSILRHPITWIAYDILRLYASLHGSSKIEINLVKNVVRKNSIEYTRISRILEAVRPYADCIFCSRFNVIDMEDPDIATLSCERDTFDYQKLILRYPSYAKKLAQNFVNLRRFIRTATKSFDYIIVNYRI